jgi:cytochrome b involved in lipid metabolism
MGLPAFEVTFYVEHRIGHCPVVYAHAHKMHHYLHDTTAWDAHIYGSGMNEEFCWILAETLPVIASNGALFPYFLNLYTLYMSWTNKSGHSRNDADRTEAPFGCDPDNFHADHHTYHRANFGLSGSPILDFYFETAAEPKARVNRRSWEVLKCPEDSKKLILRVAPMDRTKKPKVLNAPAPAALASPTSEGWRGRYITTAELANRATSAGGGPWVALHGAVFNVGAFQNLHPGGPDVLLQYAGTDATATFDDVGHSAKAKTTWAQRYVIGRLEGQELDGFAAELKD